MRSCARRLFVPVAFTVAAIVIRPQHLPAQSALVAAVQGHDRGPEGPALQTHERASSTHVVIPFLANATRPADLEFEGADCAPDAGSGTMHCTFQQVFLTTSPVAPDTCLITTNQYERTFRRETPTRWSGATSPEGACGVEETATLDDGGGVRWTMEVRKIATKGDPAACRVEEPVTFTWQNIRRPLPCRYIQPGALTQIAPRQRPER